MLREQKSGKTKGGIYHRIQIDLTYNSNHIEGSRLTHDQTRYIFETNTIGLTDGSVNVDDIFGGGGAGGFGSWADILESIRRGEGAFGTNWDFDGFQGFGGRGGNRGPQPRKGQDMNVTLNVTFDEAFRGAQKRVTVRVPGKSESETLDVKIPAGAVDGGRLRFRGKGSRSKRS